MSVESDPIEDDAIIGSAVEALLEDGDEQAAALLLDVPSFRPVYITQTFSFGRNITFSLNGKEEYSQYDAVLCVSRYLHNRFTEDVMRRIQDAISEQARSQGMYIRELHIEAPLVEPGRRARAEERLGQGPSNQGALGPPTKRWITQDRMRFRDEAELAVNRALKRAQEGLPERESLTILPNPCARSRIGSTWEPDFVVAYRGRVGMIEVDGPTQPRPGRCGQDPRPLL